MQLIRSVGAILAGLVAGMVVVMVLTYLLALLLFEGDLTAPPTPGYLATNVAYSFGAGVLAGWLAGRLAGTKPLLHGAGVAAIMAILAGGGGGSSAPGVPEWYGVALGTLMPAAALLGGFIASRGTPKRPVGGDSAE